LTPGYGHGIWRNVIALQLAIVSFRVAAAIGLFTEFTEGINVLQQ